MTVPRRHAYGRPNSNVIDVGYGSVVGACCGALIFGVVQIGITYTNISSDWFRVFLGVMLLVAVLFNNFVRQRLARAR